MNHYHSLSQQDFDLEADRDHLQMCVDVESKAVERRHQKMIRDFNKKKRVSLFAPLFNSHLLPPRQSYYPFQTFEEDLADEEEESSAVEIACSTEKVVSNMLSFLTEVELMTTTFAVSRAWAEYSTIAHVNLLVASTGTESELVSFGPNHSSGNKPILERTWEFLRVRFPWACFLAAGGAKKVYKVYNASVEHEEALSVMYVLNMPAFNFRSTIQLNIYFDFVLYRDTHSIDNMEMVANELAISSMVSSLVRRGVCPNFIALHGVFTCSFAPPESAWGHEKDKRPNGARYVGRNVTSLARPPKRSDPGRYQYIRMELINEGDAEELLKRQRDEMLPATVARSMFFQLAFSLYTGAEKFSIKHYDVKLLNVFVQNTHCTGDVVLRYGFGAHVFAVRMPPNHSYIVKLADFGTSNVSTTSNGLPVTIAHFTTLENTPPDFLFLGDAAKQGHGHDHFGLGLAMLHLFTGSRPYEEILEDVVCPPNLKKRLRLIWESEKVNSYSIVRTLILDGVDVDEYGNVEGDRDETLYDTLYRFLVLFGIPDSTFEEKAARRVWDAIFDSLSPSARRTASATRPLGKSTKKSASNDVTIYRRDCKKYSIRTGNNKYISRARRALRSLPGGIELLLSLCNFDPQKRASAKDVMNSRFMEELRENRSENESEVDYGASSTVYSYMSFATTTRR
jgi:serine/threonine protein kinase